jgi:hypothetical protein
MKKAPSPCTTGAASYQKQSKQVGLAQRKPTVPAAAQNQEKQQAPIP